MKFKSWLWIVVILMAIVIFSNSFFGIFPDWLIRTFGVVLLIGVGVVSYQFFKNRRQ